MKPPEILTAAADRLVSILDDDIAPGPWEYGEFGNPEHYGWWVSDSDGVVIIQGGNDDRWTEARYAAAMNPVVGRALVALLRSEAQVYATYEAWRADVEQRGLTVSVSSWSLDEALTLARAILGEVER